MRYFSVTCKQGHHGRGQYQPIIFAIKANNAIEAMDLAKAMPSVKHSQAILGCHEITLDEYNSMRRISAYQRLERKHETI